MSTAQQLSLLQQVLASHVLPRLPLSALQNLSQTCSATRLAVHGLPDDVLQQLAEVRPCSLELKFALELADECSCAQAERLPLWRSGRLREQLDRMAAQGAAVRAGSLQPVTQVAWPEAPVRSDVSTYLTPSGDALLATARQGALHLLPVSAGSNTLSGNMRAQPGAVQLASDTNTEAPEAAEDDDLPVRRSFYSWCLAGTHLVHADWPQDNLLRVSVFQGAQRVAGFSMPVARHQSAWQLYATAHAEAIVLILHSYEEPRGSQLVFRSPGGTLLASHELPMACAWDLSTDGRCMLAVSSDDRTLYVCASTSSARHAIQLGTPPEVRL